MCAMHKSMNQRILKRHLNIKVGEKQSAKSSNGLQEIKHGRLWIDRLGRTQLSQNGSRYCDRCLRELIHFLGENVVNYIIACE